MYLFDNCFCKDDLDSWLKTSVSGSAAYVLRSLIIPLRKMLWCLPTILAEVSVLLLALVISGCEEGYNEQAFYIDGEYACVNGRKPDARCCSDAGCVDPGSGYGCISNKPLEAER